MSLVVFPFKEEALEVVATNLDIAAGHERVDEVWAIAAEEGETLGQVRDVAGAISAASGIEIHVFTQERIGTLRPGKGDAMNTGIARAAERGFERMHFYDADITNFDAGWIDGAETAADRGFGVVRHSFPRAATDAMITWMVTRPALAMTFPGTLLPRLRQPLGGELLLVGPAIETIADDPFVRQRSDWGIDTVMTHATTLLGMGVYEHNAPDGKRHALYGSLTDIRDMVLECLDAARSLRARPGPHPDTRFAADAEAPVPADLKATVAYDVEATRTAIAGAISPPEREIMEALGVHEENLATLDADLWGNVITGMLDRFQLEDPDWRSVVFRLWVERVIHYTTHEAAKGYDSAIAYLAGTISQYETGASRSADGDGGQGEQREG